MNTAKFGYDIMPASELIAALERKDAEIERLRALLEDVLVGVGEHSVYGPAIKAGLNNH